ncbi:PTR2-domain-containing protein [Mycena capillaripes]|nr:PTR2-domain-containing protein [Mycena capillaripes]
MSEKPQHSSLTAHSSNASAETDVLRLRRVAGSIPLNAYLLGLAELVERISFFGATVVFTNFIQQPLPVGSTTGAGHAHGQSGALGLGQRASTGLTTFFWLWCYITPLFGGYIADTYLSRFKTMSIAICIRFVGHVVLTVAALPGVIDRDGATGIFVVAMIILGLGTGLFQSNISPLLGEQCTELGTGPVVRVTKSGKSVLVDPALTISRVFLYFYLVINVGALIGQIGMTYAEKYVGFWLAFALPAIIFLICPLVLFLGRNRFIRSSPSGAVLVTVLRLWWSGSRGKWHLNPVLSFKQLTSSTIWDDAKKDGIETPQKSHKKQVAVNEQWIEDVKMAVKACSVFAWFPIYWLTYNQLNNNLTSQAATMVTNGLPNDVFNNLAPLVLVIVIPLCDIWIYPAIRSAGFIFSPLKKFFAGFIFGAAAMVWAAVLQHFVYKNNFCGTHATNCRNEEGILVVSPLSVWIQSGCYILIAFSEVFAAVTGMEYAFTKAPKSMRSLITGVFLLTSAVSAALGEAFVSLSSDPLLIWNYGVMAVLAAATGVIFWLCVRRTDAQDTATALGRDEKEEA